MVFGNKLRIILVLEGRQQDSEGENAGRSLRNSRPTTKSNMQAEQNKPLNHCKHTPA